MKKIILFAFLALSLTSCTLFHIHRMDIEQGNVVTDEEARQIHPGMSKGEIVEIMGTPILINTFRDNRTDYVYSFHKANDITHGRYVTVYFKGDVVTEIKQDHFAEYDQ